MNTATYRGMARNAEAKQDWSTAAKFFDKAADVYPTKTGQLAQRDITALRSNAAACRDMLAQEVA
jgi:hypothetical protein